jgi:hypothetical protein
MGVYDWKEAEVQLQYSTLMRNGPGTVLFWAGLGILGLLGLCVR